ncbi:MAG: hypothetical protein L3K26_02560 [Candidatus Hydrogenedentes bacterium]|nr:hypothetical protein [Candidatus Hydrogenedentota bacterium]
MDKAKDSIKEGYEVGAMNVGIIVIFLAATLVMLFGAVAVILIVLRGFEESRASLNTEPASVLAVSGMQVPDEPHLQQNPVADRVEIKAANAAQVNGYGVLSADQGMERVHIPVNRAMALVAEGIAPYRQTPVTAQMPSGDQ